MYLHMYDVGCHESSFTPLGCQLNTTETSIFILHADVLTTQCSTLQHPFRRARHQTIQRSPRNICPYRLQPLCQLLDVRAQPICCLAPAGEFSTGFPRCSSSSPSAPSSSLVLVPPSSPFCAVPIPTQQSSRPENGEICSTGPIQQHPCFNSCTAGEGRLSAPPLMFFADSEKTAARRQICHSCSVNNLAHFQKKMTR